MICIPAFPPVFPQSVLLWHMHSFVTRCHLPSLHQISPVHVLPSTMFPSSYSLSLTSPEGHCHLCMTKVSPCTCFSTIEFSVCDKVLGG
jgi:hypothetical protein